MISVFDDLQWLKSVVYLFIVATADKVCNSQGRTERLHIH